VLDGEESVKSRGALRIQVIVLRIVSVIARVISRSVRRAGFGELPWRENQVFEGKV
jgi:hypothetical protein